MDNNTLEKHWTEESPQNFAHYIAADFVRFVESSMEHSKSNQAELAAKLGVSEGRVSQVLNNPGNLTIKKIVEYARAIGKKVALVGYDDGDAQNKNGPVPADIFAECWDRLGKPADFFELRPRGADNTHLIFIFDGRGDCDFPDCLPIEIDPSAKAATRAVENILRKQEWLNQRR